MWRSSDRLRDGDRAAIGTPKKRLRDRRRELIAANRLMSSLLKLSIIAARVFTDPCRRVSEPVCAVVRIRAGSLERDACRQHGIMILEYQRVATTLGTPSRRPTGISRVHWTFHPAITATLPRVRRAEKIWERTRRIPSPTTGAHGTRRAMAKSTP